MTANSPTDGPSPRPPLSWIALIALTIVMVAAKLAWGPGAQTEPGSEPRCQPVAAVPAATLLLFRQLPDGRIEQLRDGDPAREGDLVQPAYVAAPNLHTVVVSFDAVGGVTLHHPDESGETTRLGASSRTSTMVPIDHSFELDDAPHFERFVLVTTREPDIDVSKVLQAATRLSAMGPIAHDRPLALPPNYGQTSIVLRKPPR